MNSELPLEKFLQRWRFSKVSNYAVGDVLDFGGNEGELKEHLLCNASYTFVNNIVEIDQDKEYDTIIMSTVIEHIDRCEVNKVLKILKYVLRYKGKIIITAPAKMLKRPLEFLAALGILDKNNIDEHRHYWNKDDFRDQALSCDFNMEYSKFQFGLNQIVVFTNKDSK